MSSDKPSVSTADLISLVAEEYDLGVPTECRLLLSSVNDTYVVTIDETCYALRLHSLNRSWIVGEDDLRFELDLLDHLQAKGLPVSAPIPRRGGDALGRTRMAETERYFTLFTWAPGAPGADTEEKARLVGETLAAIHLASDGFHTELNRYALDERSLLDEPLRALESSAEQSDLGHLNFIRGEVAKIREQLRAFDPGPGGWGVIHADPQVLNIHFTDDGRITWFDFDLCGYGWRAYDIAYYYTRIPQRLRNSVLVGYEAIRPLSEAERDMLPTLGRAAWVWEGLTPENLVEKLKDPYDP